MRILTTIGILSVLSITGCATQDYVKSVADPLAERIGRLETKVTALEAMVAKPARLSDADNVRLEQASTTAKQALDASGRLATELKHAEENAKKAEDSANKAEGSANKADAAANRAEDAAKRTEAAATRADNAAISAQQAEKKAEKIFRIQQKK